MKYMFFLIVLVVTIALNGYVFIRGWQVMPPFLLPKILYSIIFWGLTATFFVRMYKGDAFSPSVSMALSEVGFTWLTAIIYFAIISLGIDILRLANHFTGFFPSVISENMTVAARSTAIAVLFVVTGLLVYGNHKFNNPVVREICLEVNKQLPDGGIRLVLVSDIHLSSYINGTHLEKYVEMINGEKPDIVLIAGDIADRSLKPLKEWNISAIFKKIDSRYGVFAISGNHEFYGGEREEIYSYLRSSGIEMLLDSAVTVAGGIQIVGREDKTNRNRSTLPDLMKGINHDYPVILMDHQPFGLEEAQNNGVDLQLSGHTHNGQFWPGNLIVKMMYEIGYGYGKKGDTHYYVTSGVGLWGPKFRIGTESEIVVIKLKNS